MVLFALRTDGGKLEVFVTCKAPCRAAWLSTHVIEGEWRPAASPKTKGERCNLLAQYQECCDRSNQGQRANVPASAASPARPPKDREGLQAARPPEDREDLGLPPLAAVSFEPRQLAPAPSPASMFSLRPAQRTAAESAAAERAAAEEAKERAAAERAAQKARRAERERRMCEEGERALWHEAARASTTWRRVHDPSDDEGGPPCPEACGPLFEAQDKVGDEAGDEVGEEAEDHDETNRSLSRFGASRSANSSAAHSIAASPFHAIPSRSVRPCHDHAIPSLDDDLPSVLRAHPGDDASDVYERWCDYGPELMRGRPYRPQMPTKPPPLDVARQPNLLALEARSLAGEYVGERNAAGQCEGRGKYVFADGAVYEGEFKAGKAEGRGKHRTAVGDVYEGELKAGKREGRGIYWYANGDVYEGELKAGKKEGRGIYRYANGDVYEGEWKAGKKEGRGIYLSADGDVDEGEYKAGIYQYASNVVCRAQPQEPHSDGAFEERRDLPASLQWKLELSDIMIEQLRYRHSKAHGMAARGEIQLELQQLLLERVGLDNRMANEKYYY